MTGSSIISARKQKGMSQEFLAEIAKVSLRTIQRIEANDTVPRPHTLKVIADALDISIVDLIGPQKPTAVSSDNIKFINLSSLWVAILPVVHIFIILSSARNRNEMSAEVKKILSIQVLWTIVTPIAAIMIQAVQVAITNNRVIGQLPPTVILVYGAFLVANLAFILHTSYRLQKGERSILSSIPAFF